MKMKLQRLVAAFLCCVKLCGFAVAVLGALCRQRLRVDDGVIGVGALHWLKSIREQNKENRQLLFDRVGCLVHARQVRSGRWALCVERQCWCFLICFGMYTLSKCKWFFAIFPRLIWFIWLHVSELFVLFCCCILNTMWFVHIDSTLLLQLHDSAGRNLLLIWLTAETADKQKRKQ